MGHLDGDVGVVTGAGLELHTDPASPLANSEIAGRFNSRIVTYCWQGPGARSLLAADTLRRMGYGNVATMSAGVKAWKEEGRAVERGEEVGTASGT